MGILGTNRGVRTQARCANTRPDVRDLPASTSADGSIPQPGHLPPSRKQPPSPVILFYTRFILSTDKAGVRGPIEAGTECCVEWS